MGCYDTVNFRCHSCFKQIPVQSKGGACDLKVYPAWRVPADVAAYISGDEGKCPYCAAPYVVRTAPIPDVQCRLEAPDAD